MSMDATGGRGEPVRRNPVVTVAALYGAGGSVVGPRVAERLGVEFLDRAVPASVAERMGVPEEVAACGRWANAPGARSSRTWHSTTFASCATISRGTRVRRAIG